jgi:hypothetical protein
MENRQNPLSKYFRQPAIYIKLPSEGKFWPEGSVNLPVNGELPIYPLTTRDEITLRTPDALMNGSGVVEVIQSCVPNIVDAWQTPSVDIDAILIAIRIASYGERMDLESGCPHCRARNTHSVGLQNALSSIRCPDYDKLYKFQEHIEIKFCPTTFFGKNRQNALNFEQQKMLQALESATLPDEERANIINTSMKKLVDLNNEILTESTEYVEIDSKIKVDDKDFIMEFYTEAPTKLNKEIQETLSEISTYAGIKSQPVNCSECGTEYQLPLTFDYAAFFGQGS